MSSSVFYVGAECTGALCTPAMPTRELDALLDAAIATGLVPAGSVR